MNSVPIYSFRIVYLYLVVFGCMCKAAKIPLCQAKFWLWSLDKQGSPYFPCNLFVFNSYRCHTTTIQPAITCKASPLHFFHIAGPDSLDLSNE